MSDEETTVQERPTFHYEPDTAAGGFVMLIARENELTVDGRMFTPGAITWRDLPLPLTLNRQNNAEGQHKSASGIGAITEIWRDGHDIYGRGFFSADDEGQSARKLIREGTISHVSADVGGVKPYEFDADSGEEEFTVPEGARKVFAAGTVMGVTALLHSSFNDTKIAVEEDAIIASADGDPWRPNPEWFDNPRLSGPTPLTVTADGRVYGHAALWGTCHVGYKDRCVQPPRSSSNYAFFSTGTVLTADGSIKRVGRLTANTNHATQELAAQPARDHYDHTGFAAAYVAAGEDEYGIWYSGAIAPDATDAQIANIRAAAVSGDWRGINSSLEMVGLLAVNTPGFPIPRPTALIADGAPVTLIAAGMLELEDKDDDSEDDGDEDQGDEAEYASRKKKGCGCGCDGEEMTTEEDCGCSEEMAVAPYPQDRLIDWGTDLDQNFITQARNIFAQLQELANQATNTGTALGFPTQSYGAWLEGFAQNQLSYLDRSLGVARAPQQHVDTPAAYEAEDTVTASATLSLEARLALLDMDLEII